MLDKIKKLIPYAIIFLVSCIIAAIVYAIRVNMWYCTHPGGEITLIFIPMIIYFTIRNYKDFKELKAKYDWEDYDIFSEEE